MSDSEIITKQAQVDTINKITKDQQNMIESCIDMLKTIKNDNKITEATLRNLTSVMRELDSLRELFYNRLFNSLSKNRPAGFFCFICLSRNHILDCCN